MNRTLTLPHDAPLRPRDRLHPHGFTVLLGALLITAIASPLLRGPLTAALTDCIFTVLMFTGAYAASQSRATMLTCLVLTGLAVIAILLSWVVPHQHPVLDVAPYALIAAALMFVAFTIVRYVVTAGRVTINLISAGLCVYLLIGIIWAFIFTLIQITGENQDPFGLSAKLGQEVAGDRRSAMQVLSYYSFVTMTTLGYGDIVPLTRVARTFAVLEAVVGQLYLAVFIASLIGLHIAGRRGAPED